jgi:hypothetical protein
MTMLLVASTTFITAVAWIGVWYLIPEAEMRLFRHRLWKVRDELHAAIRHGRFKEAEQPDRLLNTVECMIYFAPEISALTSVVIAAYVRSQPATENADTEINWEAMNDYDRHVLLPYSRRFDEVLLHHVFFGSPSGWLLVAIATPPALARAASKKLLCNKSQRPVMAEESVLTLAKTSIQDRARERGVERKLVGVIAANHAVTATICN